MGKFDKDWDALDRKIDSQRDGGREVDDRFYAPVFTKEGTCSVLGRFLPSIGDEVPMVYTYKHFIRGRNGIYRESCPTTIAKKCPVCDDNSEKWAAGDQETGRLRKRSRGGIINWLVINDFQNPANNGKVFLFNFGAEILNKIELARNPTSVAKKKIVPWSYSSGANFILAGKKIANESSNGGNASGTQRQRIRNSWADSEFEAPSLIGTDEFIEHNIIPFLASVEDSIDPKMYKSYDELKELFEKVIGVNSRESSDRPTNVFQSAQIPQEQYRAPMADCVEPRPAAVTPQTFQPEPQRQAPPRTGSYTIDYPAAPPQQFKAAAPAPAFNESQSYPEADMEPQQSTEVDDVAFFQSVKAQARKA